MELWIVHPSEASSCQSHLEKSGREVALHEAHNTGDLPVVVGPLDPDGCGVTVSEASLEMLGAPHALEAAVHHDGQAGAQGFAFLHAATQK